MGNCLVHQEKLVRVMKTDGKILEYKAPIKVHQVLSDFPNHAISDKLPVIKHLHPYAELIEGRLYYLDPIPVMPPSPVKNKIKKTVRFSDDVVDEPRKPIEVVRIKLVVSKQQLQALLSEGGASVADVISRVQKESSVNKLDVTTKIVT